MKETFRINWKARELTSHVTLSRRYVKHPSPEEVERLFQEPGISVFVNHERDVLERCQQSDLSHFWATSVEGHLSEEEQVDILDFPDGYCYVPSLWKGHGGTKILVLTYCH